MSFSSFATFLLILSLITATPVSASYEGVKITTKVVPGNDDFFLEVSVYGVYNRGGSWEFANLSESRFSEASFLFYAFNRSYYLIWHGDELSSEFHRAFYSNGSWYLLLQDGYPLLRINGKPFARVYPYNLTYNSIAIYKLTKGCIEPIWFIPTRFPGESSGSFGRSRLENDTLVFSSYAEAVDEGFTERIPLKAFEKYLPIINASAFADSLLATQLADGTMVIYFPELYYFDENGSVYAGIVQNNDFVPIFKLKTATSYIFTFHDVLDAVPTLEVNLNEERILSAITGQYSVRNCYKQNHSSLFSDRNNQKTDFMSDIGLVFLSLIIGLLFGGFLGYNLRHK